MQRSARNTFAGLELDRAHQLRSDADWLAQARAAGTTRWLASLADGSRWCTAPGDALQWLEPDALDAVQRAQGSLLGCDAQQRAYFHVALSAPPAGGGRAQPLRALAAGANAFVAGLAGYAVALAHWQAHSRHCPACGAATVREEAGHRARCPACGHLQFPRTDAAVIVLVEHEGAALLGRRPGWPDGRFSTLAGFVEPGEALEDAVRREIAEESGAQVVACRYHSSQPWPFPASLMLGFRAQAASRALGPGDGELAELRWIERGQMRAGLAAGTLSLPPAYSVAQRLIRDWLDDDATR